MILRRFIKHVTDQNWFAVGLDVCVVIVGIFLGMQVNEWHLARQQQEEEIAYLYRIADDLKATSLTFEDNIQRMEDWIEGGTAALKALQDPTLSMPNDAGKYFARATQVDPSRPIISAITELQSDGKMGIISNETLRAQIAQMAAEMESYWHLRNNLVPYVSSVIPDIQTKIRREHHSGQKGKDETIVFDRQKLSEDNAFMNALGYTIHALYFNLTWLQRTKQLSDEMQVVVLTELARLTQKEEGKAL